MQLLPVEVIKLGWNGAKLLGDVEIITLNSTYHAFFTCSETRAAFIKTCETIGRLK